MNLPLHYYAAKHAMGTLHSDAIKTLIHALVDEGFYLDELVDTLDTKRPLMADVEPALLAALIHNGIVVPSKEQAVWQLLEFHLQRIASGEDDALDGLGRLIADVYWDYDFRTPTKEWLGDSHGIEQLIGYFWGADDLRTAPEPLSWNGMHGEAVWSEVKRQIIVEAQRWLNARRSTTVHSLD